MSVEAASESQDAEHDYDNSKNTASLYMSSILSYATETHMAMIAFDVNLDSMVILGHCWGGGCA